MRMIVVAERAFGCGKSENAMPSDVNDKAFVSAIVPTIGRPESLYRLLESLCKQTMQVGEVIVADGDITPETETVTSDPVWKSCGLLVRRIGVSPPHAVRQRQAAIGEAIGEF